MYQQRLSSLRDYILQQNPYLNDGYLNAIMTDDGVLVPANGELFNVFPNDTLGDYFYIRDTKSVNFVPDPNGAFDDCTRSFRRNGQHIIMVSVRDADPDLLSENVLTSLSGFSPDEIVLNSIISENTQVVMQELGESQKQEIEKSLANLSNQTLVAITFTLSVPFVPVKCITNPCKQC